MVHNVFKSSLYVTLTSTPHEELLHYLFTPHVDSALEDKQKVWGADFALESHNVSVGRQNMSWKPSEY